MQLENEQAGSLIGKLRQKSMNEKQDATKNESLHMGITEDVSTRDGNAAPIRTGKKVGLYGCGLLLLGLVIIAVIIFLTGVYVPFEGTEGVGP